MRPGDEDREPYGVNVTRWKAEHPRYVLAGGFEAVGYRARPREGTGPWVSALTLDELDAKLEQEEKTP